MAICLFTVRSEGYLGNLCVFDVPVDLWCQYMYSMCVYSLSFTQAANMILSSVLCLSCNTMHMFDMYACMHKWMERGLHEKKSLFLALRLFLSWMLVSCVFLGTCMSLSDFSFPFKSLPLFIYPPPPSFYPSIHLGCVNVRLRGEIKGWGGFIKDTDTHRHTSSVVDVGSILCFSSVPTFTCSTSWCISD